MTKNKNTGRKTQRIVRMPASKCGHLRRKMKQRISLGPKPCGR